MNESPQSPRFPRAPKPGFAGPLFIIGMPRSGTKLLRALMNEHSSVRIPRTETEFLPFWVKNWNSLGPTSDPADFRRFYRSCQSLPFFVYLNSAGKKVDPDEWYARCRSFTPAGVFEGLLRTHLRIDYEDTTIWGDKSPSYIGHIPLLRNLYPDARFIHIVRDVRDYCLSINRAWGKHMLRAAQRWADDVSRARAAGAALGDGYMEIRYEDLLENPELAVRRVCEFSGIPFFESMLRPGRPTENIGDAKGTRGIVQTNTRKYETRLGGRARRTIESIACQTLKDLGYECDYAGTPARLGKLRLRYYQGLDGLNLLLFSARDRGMAGAASFVWRYFLISGNRHKPQQ